MIDILTLTGNTVRLKTTFKNLDDANIDPDSVKILFYNEKQVKIEEVVLGEANKEDIGKYFYDYVAPIDKSKVYFEWNGTISGNPSIERGMIRSVFIK